MESILKGRASQNDFNICSKGETMKVTLILEQPSYLHFAVHPDTFSKKSICDFFHFWSKKYLKTSSVWQFLKVD